MSITTQLARFCVETKYDDLPSQVREAAKTLVFDTVGCAIGAIATAPGRAVSALADLQGMGRATVLGTGQKTGPLAAAYANGRLGNILDIDECYMFQGHHAQATLSAGLALCEQTGKGGRDLLTAFSVGFEVGIRLGNYFRPALNTNKTGAVTGWTGLVGPGQGVYAACAAAASILELTVEQTAHALALCPQYMVHRDWSRQWGRDLELGTIKYADTGWNAQAGMMAALAARSGITGMQAVFDTRRFDAVFPAIDFDPDALVADLGSHWSVQNTSFKFWPCCRWIHYPLTSLERLVSEHRLKQRDIIRIELSSFPMIPYPRFASDRDPANLVAATFSFAHAAAMVVLGVPPGPAWFSNHALEGEAAHRMRQKVVLSDDDRGRDPAAWGLQEGVLRIPSAARIQVGDRVLERTDHYALGDPWEGAPRFGETELTKKFRCLTLAASPGSGLWHGKVSRLMEVLFDLAAVERLSDLTDNATVPACPDQHRPGQSYAG